MLYEDNWLAHYGIKGQLWGVRRYQNADGSLTEEGKKRYTKSFKQAEDSVKKCMTNKLKPVKKQICDIDAVMKRAGVNREDAQKCARIANDLFNKASEIEPRVTNDVVNAVRESGNTMYGLDHRLKQPTSMAGKIGSDAKEKDLSFEKAGSGLRDVLRYTSISDNDRFVSSYNDIKSKLYEMGYEEYVCKNFFDMYRNGNSKHKSVQSVFKDRDGNRFELQFQTPSSQAAKELKIPLYEEIRSSGTSPKRKVQIEKQMELLADQVPDPKDVFDIKSH